MTLRLARQHYGSYDGIPTVRADGVDVLALPPDVRAKIDERVDRFYPEPAPKRNWFERLAEKLVDWLT